MDALVRVLRQPGSRRDVVLAAPGFLLPADDKQRPSTEACGQGSTCYEPAVKPRVLDRALDALVRASGSIPMFLLLQVLVLVWAFSGIWVADTNFWSVLMGNFQAIFSYVLDSLLMRQQLNNHAENMRVIAEVASRGASHRRMLEVLVNRVPATELLAAAAGESNERFVAMCLPQQSRFDRLINKAALVLGHIYFVLIFWATMLLWLAFGPTNGWSNQWQLDLNSATSALLIFIFSFLAILRERHADYTHACVDAIYRVDATLGFKLRSMTWDHRAHPQTFIRAPSVSGLQRVIDYYAHIVGTLAGMALLTAVTVAWLAVGPVMQFSTNWWLLIGTYAGLVGLNDGFVMRNIQAQLHRHEVPQYAMLDELDRALLGTVGITPVTMPPIDTTRLTYRISNFTIAVCGHQVTVLIGFLFICGLVAGASAMQWNETGQLLCNIPPMIVESFFMIILITGHNAADAERRISLTNRFRRRLQLLNFVGRIDAFKAECPPTDNTSAAISVQTLNGDAEVEMANAVDLTPCKALPEVIMLSRGNQRG